MRRPTRRPRAPRRWSRLPIALLLVAASLAAALPSGAQGIARPLGVGTWRTTFFLDQTVDFEGINTKYDGHGSAVMAVRSGGEVDGEWNLSLRVTLEGLSVVTNGVATGTVSGDGLVQTLDFDQITVTDGQFGAEFTFTAADLPVSGGGEFVVLSSGCSAVTGLWSIPFQDQTLTGQFVSQRVRPSAPLNAQGELLEDGQVLIESAQSGVIDVAGLRSFIARAEAALAIESERSADCSLDDAAVFAHVGTSLLQTVLAQTAFALPTLTDDDFVELYRLVVRSGLLGISDDVRLGWEFALSNRLAGAITSELPSDWEYWQPIAEQFGEDAAAETLAELICRERGGGARCAE